MTKIWSNPAVWMAAVLSVVLIYVFVRGEQQTTTVPVQPTVTYEHQLQPTRGQANWWCLSGMPCWHSTDACDADRRKVYAKNGNDLPCTAVDVAACLEVERVLNKERTRECFASIAYCKAAVQSWRTTQPDDVRVVVECVAE